MVTLQGKEPVLNNFICPNVYLMYRVFGYALDTRVNYLRMTLEQGEKKQVEEEKNKYKQQWGELDIDKKIDRFLNLNLAYLGIPEEYYNLLQNIVSAYCCGYYYPAMTSAGALGERILNRLVLKLRDYYKSYPHYKNIYRKQSFDQWDLPVKIIQDWGVISKEVAELFLKLKDYRNESIHYKKDYDFESNSYDAVKVLAEIIDLQFNYLNRKDLFWVFDVPGEIWLRSEFIDEPFVIEFILPHCARIGPFCEPLATPPVKTTQYPLKPFSDEEFLELRKSKKK